MKFEEEENASYFWSHVLRAHCNHLEVLKLSNKEVSYFRENLTIERWATGTCTESLSQVCCFPRPLISIQAIYREL